MTTWWHPSAAPTTHDTGYLIQHDTTVQPLISELKVKTLYPVLITRLTRNVRLHLLGVPVCIRDAVSGLILVGAWDVLLDLLTHGGASASSMAVAGGTNVVTSSVMRVAGHTHLAHAMLLSAC